MFKTGMLVGVAVLAFHAGLATAKELLWGDTHLHTSYSFDAFLNGNMSADPEQEYFVDGLTEDIIGALARLPQIFVIARNSSFVYKGKPVKVQQVAEEIGVT